MSSTWGNSFKISIFGESHSSAIGVCIDGLPSGFKLDMEKLIKFTQRRAPGKNKMSTSRKEADAPNIISGLVNGVTTGTPLACIIENTNTRSADYNNLQSAARPGHADFTGFVRYSGFNDIRGGGHFSGRLTAPLVFAGGIAKQILSQHGIECSCHISEIAGIKDNAFDPINIPPELISSLEEKMPPVINDSASVKMQEAIENARLNCDSVGGVIECAVTGVPAGVGSPMFDGIENRIASVVFAIPAVKGIEFGNGFESARLHGSQNNDEFTVNNKHISTITNNHGGILGGISSGMPIVFRTAFKPTPSIAKTQNTVDFVNMQNVKLNITGRHDPCIVPRAAVCVEAAAAIAVLDVMLSEGKIPL